RLGVRLSRREATVVRHAGSRGGHGRWETRGDIQQMIISAQTIRDLKSLVAGVGGQVDRGRVIIANETLNDDVEIAFKADWALAFADTLTGDVNVRRLSGDFIVPADQPFPLGLQTLDLHVAARSANQAGVSRLSADLEIATKEMGRATAKASTLLHAEPDGGFTVRDADVKTVDVNADIGDL